MSPRRRFANLQDYQNNRHTLNGNDSTREVPADDTSFPMGETKERVENFGNVFFQNLNWKPGPDGTIPQDQNGRSRMFILKTITIGKNAGDVELMEYDGKKLTDGTEIRFGDASFIREMQMGNVFAYKIGEPKPIQVAYDFSDVKGHERSKFEFSEPLDSRKFVEVLSPPPPKPVRPGIFKRFLHAIVKSAFRAEFDRYDDAQKKMDNWIKKNSAHEDEMKKREQERSKLIEKGDANRDDGPQKQDKLKKEEKELKYHKDQLESSKRKLAWFSKGGAGKYAEGIFEPVPKILRTKQTEQIEEFKDRLTDDPDYNKLLREEDEKKNLKPGFASAEQYKNLTVFGKDQIDLDKIMVGETNKPVTKSQFCAVALFASTDPKYAMKANDISDEHDATIMNVLTEEVGCTENEAKSIVSATVCGMYSTDLFQSNPRDNNGMYIKCAVDPARKDAVEAFQAYQKGNRAPLAKLIASGINCFADQMTACQTFEEEFCGASFAANNLLELIDGDEALKKEALGAGMKQENLLTVRGSYELAKLRQKAFEADVKLREAAVNGVDLSEAEKKGCIKDILKAQAATQAKNLETEKMHCEKYEKLMNLTYTNGVPNMPKKNPEEQIKNLPKGKVYMATGLNMSLMMKGVVGPRPGNLMLLSKESARQNLDKVAEQIMDEDNMLNMQPRDLVKKLSFDIGSETKIGNRAMQIRIEKGYDKQPLAEIRAEAGIEEPKKNVPTNVIDKKAEVVKTGEEVKKTVPKVNIPQ